MNCNIIVWDENNKLQSWEHNEADSYLGNNLYLNEQENFVSLATPTWTR